MSMGCSTLTEQAITGMNKENFMPKQFIDRCWFLEKEWENETVLI